MTGVRDDLRLALRSLSRSPALVAVSVAILGLGIAATTVLASFFDQILLRPLPVRAPEELVILHSPGPVSGSTNRVTEFTEPLSLPTYRELATRSDVFSGLVARVPVEVNLALSGPAEEVGAEIVSGNYFDVLGVRAAAGRLLAAADDGQDGASPVVVLSWESWQRRFGGRTDAVGGSVRINGTAMTVVGVAARGFHGVQVGLAPELWVPLGMKKTIVPLWSGLEKRRGYWLYLVGRLAPGMDRARAMAAIAPFYRQMLEQDLAEAPTPTSATFRERYLKKRLVLEPGAAGGSDLRGETSRHLKFLLAMLGLVLVIACANVGGLLAARAAARHKELAVHLALGAGRLDLVRRLAAEGVVLGVAGGMAGAGLAALANGPAARWLAPHQVDAFSSELDWRILLFAAAIALVCGVATSVLPALESLGVDPQSGLRDGRGSTGGRRHLSSRRLAVALQLALSFALLSVAGLFAHSLKRLYSVPLGFDVAPLATFAVDPSTNGYDPVRARRIATDLLEAVAASPGVEAAGAAEIGLLSGDTMSSTIKAEGYKPAEDENMNPSFNAVTPGFFSTVGMRLVGGRDFTPADGADAPKVVVVTRNFADKYFPQGDAIGRHITFNRDDTTAEIVGVVADALATTVRDDLPRFVYRPFAQAYGGGGVNFYARSANPVAIAPGLRQAAQRVAPELPVLDLEPLARQLDATLSVERIAAGLASAFAGAATLLAALGLWGLLAFNIARRRREFGIRMAVGADPLRIVTLVLAEVWRLGALGLAAGLLLSAALGRLAAARLYQVAALDVSSLAGAAVVLAFFLVAAAALPADRAARIDPSRALRED
ncbi:MAG: ADOP family duplicated permease [Thermoanaerobaculia bacterium]